MILLFLLVLSYTQYLPISLQIFLVCFKIMYVIYFGGPYFICGHLIKLDKCVCLNFLCPYNFLFTQSVSYFKRYVKSLTKTVNASIFPCGGLKISLYIFEAILCSHTFRTNIPSWFTKM